MGERDLTTDRLSVRNKILSCSKERDKLRRCLRRLLALTFIWSAAADRSSPDKFYNFGSPRWPFHPGASLSLSSGGIQGQALFVLVSLCMVVVCLWEKDVQWRGAEGSEEYHAWIYCVIKVIKANIVFYFCLSAHLFSSCILFFLHPF